MGKVAPVFPLRAELPRATLSTGALADGRHHAEDRLRCPSVWESGIRNGDVSADNFVDAEAEDSLASGG